MIDKTYHNRDPGDEQPDGSVNRTAPWQQAQPGDLDLVDLRFSVFTPLLDPKILAAARAYNGNSAIQYFEDGLVIELPISIDLIDEQSWVEEALIYQLDFSSRREADGLVISLKYTPRSLRWIDRAPPPGIEDDYAGQDALKFTARVNAFCQLYCLDELRLSTRLLPNTSQEKN